MMRIKLGGLLGSLWLGVALCAPSVWQEKMLVRDRISKDDGRYLELMGFSISRGDFIVEVDQLNRQIIAISGSFQDVDPEMFNVLKSRLAQSPIPGFTIDESRVAGAEGEKQRTIHLDLRGLDLAFEEDFVWSIRNSESLDIKLSLEKISRQKVSLSLEMDLGDSIQPVQSKMKLLDQVQL